MNPQTKSENYTGVKCYCTKNVTPFTKIHRHSICIFCVLEGSLVISDSFSNYKLTQGNIHIINPGYPYFICEDFSISLVVEIDLRFYKNFFPELHPHIYFTCQSKYNSNLLENKLAFLRYIMSRIFISYNNEKQHSVLINYAKSMLQFLLDHFQSYIFEKDDDNNYKILLNTSLKKHFDPLKIYRIIDYIYLHSRTPLNLSELAKNESFSTTYLSKFIKSNSGLSFSSHLSMARCEDAEKLLIKTQHPIDVIATDVGFSNRQHLNTNFKRWYKMSPSEYRKTFFLMNSVANRYSIYDDNDYILNKINPYLVEVNVDLELVSDILLDTSSNILENW